MAALCHDLGHGPLSHAWEYNVIGELDKEKRQAWTASLGRLSQAGVIFSDETIALVDDMVQVNAKGGFAPTEAYAIHRERLKNRGETVDPFIRVRIERGGTVLAADYIEMGETRRRLVQAMDARMAPLDALVLPTTPRTCAACAPACRSKTGRPRRPRSSV